MPARVFKDNLVLETTGSPPSTPASGEIELYAKTSDKLWYAKDDTGAETSLSGSITVRDELGNVSITDVTTLTVTDGALVDDSGGAARLLFVPRTDKRRLWMANCSGTLLAFSGNGLLSSAGTIASSNQSDSAYSSCTTAASANAVAGFAPSAFTWCRSAHDPYFVATIQLTGTLTGIRVFAGYFNSAPTTDTFPNNSAGFRYSDGASDGGWRAVTRDASAQTVSAQQGSNIAADTAYKLEMWLTNSGTKAFFRVNNGTILEQSVNLPSTTVDLGPVVRILTTGAAARVLRLSRAYGDAA